MSFRYFWTTTGRSFPGVLEGAGKGGADGKAKEKKGREASLVCFRGLSGHPGSIANFFQIRSLPGE